MHRLDLLVLQGAHGWDILEARRTVNAAFDMVIHLERDHVGHRRVTQAGVLRDGTTRLDLFVDETTS